MQNNIKILVLAAVGLLASASVHAQSTLFSNSSAVGINTTNPRAGIALDAGSNTNSVLVPSGTTGQRPTGVNGMLRYNTSLNQMEAYVNGAWTSLSGGGTAQGSATSWVQFDGTSCGSGTCSTVNGSFNVSSVTSPGGGQYQVHFTNSMASTNYGVLITCTTTGSNARFGSIDKANQATPLSTSSVYVSCWKSSTESDSASPIVTVATYGP